MLCWGAAVGNIASAMCAFPVPCCCGTEPKFNWVAMIALLDVATLIGMILSCVQMLWAMLTVLQRYQDEQLQWPADLEEDLPS